MIFRELGQFHAGAKRVTSTGMDRLRDSDARGGLSVGAQPAATNVITGRDGFNSLALPLVAAI